MTRGRRLRAPREDGGILIDPPWPELVALVGANVAAAPDSSLAELRSDARRELLTDALTYTQQYRDVDLGPALHDAAAPLVLAGHQPEMFHAGVWAKNFALARLAVDAGAVAVNLVVDGDTLKTPALRVPVGSPDDLHVESVPFDAPGEEIAYEERGIVDAALFESFGRRAAQKLAPLVPHPLLTDYWPLVVEEAAQTRRLGESIARARHRLEESWGVQSLEYPQSRMCETRGFARFTSRLLADLPRFHEAHNSALAEYRRVEHVRSANHPVPELTRDDDLLEAPLWIWTADEPHRRRAFVRRVGREVELTDRGKVRVRFPLAEAATDESAVEAILALPRQGIRLRSRALLTTMYARLVLGDLFVHGIGGAKYDQLTDEIVRRFFGCEPPPFGVVTATRQLPIAGPPRFVPPTPVVVQRLWELTHHPERRLDWSTLDPAAAQDVARLLEEKRRWTEVEPTREKNGRARCRAIRAANAALQAHVVDVRREDEELLASARRRDRIDEVSVNREFSCFFFPEKDLRDFMLAIGGPTR